MDDLDLRLNRAKNRIRKSKKKLAIVLSKSINKNMKVKKKRIKKSNKIKNRRYTMKASEREIKRSLNLVFSINSFR